jgi:hypothetical protein
MRKLTSNASLKGQRKNINIIIFYLDEKIKMQRIKRKNIFYFLQWKKLEKEISINAAIIANLKNYSELVSNKLKK